MKNRVQGAGGSRIQVKGKEVKPLNPRILESLNPGFVLNTHACLIRGSYFPPKRVRNHPRHAQYPLLQNTPRIEPR